MTGGGGGVGCCTTTVGTGGGSMASSEDGILPSTSKAVGCEKGVLRGGASLDLRLDFLALPFPLVGCDSIVTASRPRETPSEPESMLSRLPSFDLA